MRKDCSETKLQLVRPTWDEPSLRQETAPRTLLHTPQTAAPPISVPTTSWEQALGHLRFNPNNRLPTAAQRKALLRRDRYRYRTPGCPHHRWLHLHHTQLAQPERLDKVHRLETTAWLDYWIGWSGEEHDRHQGKVAI